MQSTNHRLWRRCVAIILMMCISCISFADIRRATVPLTERLDTAFAYGIGTVTWGAIKEKRGEAPQLFLYGVTYGGARNKSIRICSEIGLMPGQKVLFASQKSARSNRCGDDALYIPINGHKEFVFAGYEDIVKSTTWFKLPSGYVENFDCDVEIITTSFFANKGSDASRVEVFGIPGAGKYFSANDFFSCLKTKNMAPWR